MNLPLLRQSERGAFKRCQWAWWQSHVNPILGGEGIAPIAEKWKEAADFGTIFHVCLAEYYLPGTKRGPHPAETWTKLAGDVRASVRTTREEDQIKIWEDFYELGLQLAEAYVERYQGDPHWDVLDAERRFDVVIPDTRHAPGTSAKGRRIYKPIVKLVGTIDLCFRDLNYEYKGKPAIKMVDHKTAGRIETHHLTLDEQASTYIAVATHALREQELIGEKEVVHGMEYNFIKRAAIDDRPRDEYGRARNRPTKKHYIEAIMAIDAEVGIYQQDTEQSRKQLSKSSLGQLAELALSYDIKNVYGDVSADQSGESFRRHFVPRTPKERQRTIVRISEEARVMDMVRRGELPVLKTPQRDCAYCKFFDLCELDENGSDTDYFIKTTMKPNDPYADHRANAVNSKKVSDSGSN